MIVFPDPLLATAGAVRTVAVAVLDPAESLTVVTRDYPPDSADRPALPYVVVSIDTAAPRRDVVQVATMRLVVHHESPYAALRVARLLDGGLREYRGDSDVHRFSYDTGPVLVDDPDTGEPIAALTLIARLRALTI